MTRAEPDAGGGAGPRLILASASPRRSRLLSEAGFSATGMPADLDDADLAPRGTAPPVWAMAMAWLKARRVADLVSAVDCGPAIVLAADTVCELDGEVIGKPEDEDHCARMLRSMSGRDHRVHTGCCLLDRARSDRRLLFVDTAMVGVGLLDEAAIARHVASGAWRGKAGGYNLADQVSAGWPLRCDGDPATVMGLPLRRLAPLLGAMLVGTARDGRRGDAATMPSQACLL